MRRCIEAVARAGAPARGIALAAAALGAAAWLGGSAAGLAATAAAAVGVAWWLRRRGGAAAGGDGRLTLVSSIALPGGGRVHEISLRGATLVVACAGGAITIHDERKQGGPDA